MKLIPKDYGNN